MNWIPSNGTASELYGGKLILAGFLLFVYGALNNIGIGSYALTMVTVYLLGLNPVAAFPIMMGLVPSQYRSAVFNSLNLMNTAEKSHFLLQPSVYWGIGRCIPSQIFRYLYPEMDRDFGLTIQCIYDVGQSIKKLQQLIKERFKCYFLKRRYYQKFFNERSHRCGQKALSLYSAGKASVPLRTNIDVPKATDKAYICLLM